MKINKDIEKILLNLNEYYYKKGMSKLSVSVKGIRANKLTNADINYRKTVISKLLSSKENEKFVRQFLENIKEDLELLSKNSYTKQIVDNPIKNEKLIEKCDFEILYLYLLSLDDQKYTEIMKIIVEKVGSNTDIQENQKKNESQNDKSDDIEKYKIKCYEYEKEIISLKEVSKQRKEKLKELEIQNNILNEENTKLKNTTELLHKQIKEMKEKIEEFKSIISTQIENKEEKQYKILIIDNERLINVGNKENILVLDINEYFSKDDSIRKQFEQILVYNKGIQISKLRKVKRLSVDTAKFFEKKEELLKYLDAMEEKNEDRCN